MEGGTINITANSGDVPLVQTLTNPNIENPNSNDQAPSWGPYVGGLINSGLQETSLLPGFNLAMLPVSINYRNAGSTITVGQYASIIGSGDVTLNSTSTADAEGEAMWKYSTQFGFAIAFMMGVTNAQLSVNSNASIDSTGGNVNLWSTANTTATDTARVSQNIGSEPADSNAIAIALAVGVVNQTANATISSGATVKAANGIDFVATGTGENTSIPTTGTYVSGAAGVALGVNVTENNITATADGTLISGASATTPTLIINPDSSGVDYVNSAFKVSPVEYATLQTGDAFAYSSGDNGPIGGLTSGTLYYIILPSNLTDEIQLASSLSNAQSGTFIPFQQYPTLTGGSTTMPVSQVDDTDATITFDSDPGFTDGEALTYNAVAGQMIGGLTNGATYYAIVNSASPDTLQLAATPPPRPPTAPNRMVPRSHSTSTPSSRASGRTCPSPSTPAMGQPTRSSLGFAPVSCSARAASSTRGPGSAACKTAFATGPSPIPTIRTSFSSRTRRPTPRLRATPRLQATPSRQAPSCRSAPTCPGARTETC